MRSRPFSTIAFALAVAATISPDLTRPTRAAEPVQDEGRAARRPAEFFSIFNFGYGGDDFPEDPALFEMIVAKVRGEGGFNAVLCGWRDEREAICRRHGLKIMVDLLAAKHHVYKAPAEAEALLRKLRGNDVVMGYHLWSDRIGDTGAGRIRDIRNCNAWDPTHPAYAATYKTGEMAAVAQADIFGWYDFHWKRSGWNRHFNALQTALPLALENDSVFYSLLSTDSGQPGKGNYNRSLWSANQGIAFGMKGVLWFIGMRQMDKATGEWTEIGRDINKVNARIMPLAEELPKLGLPTAVYATPLTRNANNEDIAGGPRMLGELAGNAFPADFWIQPAAGEFTLGLFRDAAGRDAVYVASMNAYAEQQVALRLAKPLKTSIFDRAAKAWVPLPVTAGQVRMRLGPGEGELVRFE